MIQLFKSVLGYYDVVLGKVFIYTYNQGRGYSQNQLVTFPHI